MRVLYGIQGTGNGHLARARALVPAMRTAGIDVDFVISGRPAQDLFSMELFENCLILRGLTLCIERGKVNYSKTITRNNIAVLLRDMYQLELSNYDLLISDFEPITAWAAKLKGIPSVGISHQAAFQYDVPKVGGFLISRILMKLFAPSPEQIGFHWHHFNQPILPPLIEAHESKPAIEKKILVYMGFELVEDLVEFLRPFSDYTFEVFAKVDSVHRFEHITINPLSHREFHRHLADCSGVISNAGFELASECLALGKKLLVRPLSGQYEQFSNALGLQAMRRATVMTCLDGELLRDWLRLPPHQLIDYPDVATALARWFLQAERCSVEELANELWDQLFVPYSYDRHFGDELQTGLIN